MEATIKPLEKGFVLMLGDHELGTSKTDFDARFHMHAINAVMEKIKRDGYNEGYADGSDTKQF